MEEVWKPVTGFHLCEASSHGRIRMFDPKRKEWTLRAQSMGSHGYLIVNSRRLLEDGRVKRSATPVHTLVCIAFHGERPPGLIVCHRDDDELNNVPGNLRWGTHQDNLDDQKRNGVFGWRGARQFNKEQVQEVMNRLQQGDSENTVAHALGSSRRSIQAIKNGETYREVVGNE